MSQFILYFHIVFAIVFCRIVFIAIGQYYKIKSGKAEECEPYPSRDESNFGLRTRVSNGFWGCSEVPEMMAGYALGILIVWFVFFLVAIYAK